MKEIVVISGKGGTGKTSIVASFAALAKNVVLSDCDVDAADLHLMLEPDIKRTSEFSGGKQAFIDTNKCIGCGDCQLVCKFDAVHFKAKTNDTNGHVFAVDPIYCEGCGVCAYFCRNDAIEFKDVINGQWFLSNTRFGTLVHAKLGIAEENSGKLVSLLRKQAKEIAEKENKDLIIIDGSPGIGCPVIASVTGADLVLIITEPTLSGKHDLERVMKLTAGFNIETVVVINKYDLNKDMTDEIVEYTSKRNVKVIGTIRYDNAFTKSQIKKCPVVEYTDSAVTEDIKTIWRNLINVM